jgi:hypothetical protein
MRLICNEYAEHCSSYFFHKNEIKNVRWHYIHLFLHAAQLELCVKEFNAFYHQPKNVRLSHLTIVVRCFDTETRAHSKLVTLLLLRTPTFKSRHVNS